MSNFNYEALVQHSNWLRSNSARSAIGSGDIRMIRSGLAACLSVIACLHADAASAASTDREKLVGDEVVGYFKGNTVYVDIVPGKPFGKGGLSPFYYAADGRFAATLPNSKLAGTWQISDKASYCINIPKYGKTFCTNVFRTDKGLEHHSVGLKKLMGPVKRLVPGNAEKL